MPLFRPPRSPGASLSRYPVVPFAFCLRLLRLPPCPKTGLFGVPKPEIQRCRWAKRALLPIRGRKTGLSLGKTGVFAHPRPENRTVVGQNKRFCPSKDEKQAFRWAKPAYLPIRAQKSSLSLGKSGTFAHQRVGKAEPDSRKWRVWAGGMSLRGAQGIQGVTQGVGLKIFLREM